ncbi:MAG: amidohydrolase family protein [Lachnospiraceae bacterium]|nr:amidohydrolase family protein [Lachnospiraceae bacterium]
MSTYLLIKQADIYDAVQDDPYVADILVKDGKIERIEEIIEGRVVNEARIIDADGLRIYPGFVEAHCHLGLDGYTGGFAQEDFNELNDCITPQLSAVDGINPMDPTFAMARQAGVTCVATGPGSSNVLGGTFAVIKTAGCRVDDMIVKEKAAMKCAFGENPKNCYREKSIYCRMTIAAKLREMFYQAIDYEKNKTAYDAKLEALLPVLHKQMPLKAHVHRADDIFTAIRVAKEFDIGLTLDHCTEGHLIAEELAKEPYSLAVGPSFGHATKKELENKSFATPGILADAGCQVSIITDSPVVQEQYLTLCAAMAIRSGMKEQDALRAITINAARHIGVSDRVGSIEVGKDADFVLIKGSPFVYENEIRYTIIDGQIVYERTE